MSKETKVGMAVVAVAALLLAGEAWPAVVNGEFEYGFYPIDGWIETPVAPYQPSGTVRGAIPLTSGMAPGPLAPPPPFPAEFSGSAAWYQYVGIAGQISGIGLTQTATFSAGDTLWGLVAASSFAEDPALSLGMFQLIIDGVVVDSVNFGALTAGNYVLSTFGYMELDVLSAVLSTTGPHTITFAYIRDGLGNAAAGSSTVSGWLDHVMITSVTNGIPEPTILALFGLGLAGLGAMRRKKLAA